MTRINCCSIKELNDKMFGAEYHELPRIRHAHPLKNTAPLPITYRMGTGHCRFFYNKGLFLIRRFNALVRERDRRGLKVSYRKLDLSHWPKWAMNDWKPNATDIEINRNRIKERMGR